MRGHGGQEKRNKWIIALVEGKTPVDVVGRRVVVGRSVGWVVERRVVVVKRRVVERRVMKRRMAERRVMEKTGVSVGEVGCDAFV